MFRYAVKKAFFDLWDNLGFAFGVNLLFTMGTLGVALLGRFTLPLGNAAFLLFFPLPVLFASVAAGVVTFWARDAMTEGQAHFSSFFSHLASSWRPSLFFGSAWLVLGVGQILGVPFYSQVNSLMGTIFGIFMIWFFFFGVGMSLYFPGLNAQVEPHVGKLLRKSFLMFVAHPWSSLVTFLVLLLLVAVSIFTLGFFPGIFGIAVWLQVTFRFLLAKYDWLEKEPDADRKKVPWSVILADDMDRVGHRSFRSLFFPWKD